MSGYGAFALYYDALTTNIGYSERACYFDQIIKKHGGNPGILLDLACGTGSLSMELSQIGYEVIGVDASADMLSLAIQKNLSSEKKVLFLNQGMDKLDLYGTVDATVCALDSINHIENQKKLLDVFKSVALFTNPGGLFIFDANTPYKHREILGDNSFVYDLPEVFCCWQNALDSETLRVDITLDFFSRKAGFYSRESESFSEWIYADDILLDLLEQAGFEHLQTLEADTHKQPAPTAQRLVYVARKK